MKRFEVKTITLLTLPVLAFLLFAWVLSLRNQKHDFGPPYRITRHEVVREHAMTKREKQIARISKLPEGRAVVYRYAIEPRRVSFFEEHLLGATNTSAWGNGSSCHEEGTKLGIMPHSSSGDGNGGWMEIYDFADIDDHPVVFSFPLTWEEGGKQQTRTVTKRVVAQELK